MAAVDEVLPLDRFAPVEVEAEAESKTLLFSKLLILLVLPPLTQLLLVVHLLAAQATQMVP